MSRIRSDQLIRIRSADREPGYDENDFVIQTRRLQGTYLLEQALVPNTAYHIKAGVNDTFQLDVAGTTKTITVPPGFYNPSTLTANLTTALNQPSEFSGLTCSYDDISGKLSFSHASLALSVVGTAPALGWSSATATPDTTITADDVLVLTTVNAYLFHISNCEGQIRNGTGVLSDPTFIVEVGFENAQEFVHFKASEDLQQLIHFAVEQSELRITLKDEKGRSVDLNGSDWAIILRKVHDGPPTAK